MSHHSGSSAVPHLPHSLFLKPFPHLQLEEGPYRESQWHRAYLAELLDAPKDPHHTINLLLQAPGPVLHPVCREERSVRRTRLQPEQPRPGHLGTDGSLPGFFVHGIFQARVLEWVASAFSKNMPSTGL